jgi:hypothetical protein
MLSSFVQSVQFVKLDKIFGEMTVKCGIALCLERLLQLLVGRIFKNIFLTSASGMLVLRYSFCCPHVLTPENAV